MRTLILLVRPSLNSYHTVAEYGEKLCIFLTLEKCPIIIQSFLGDQKESNPPSAQCVIIIYFMLCY